MAVLGSDAFTRANETPVASPWTQVYTGGTRTFNLASNALAPTLLSQDGVYKYTGPTWPNDQYSQCTCTVTGTGADTGPGVTVRCGSPSASSTWYRLSINKAASNNLVLYKSVAGALTRIAQRTITFTDGHTLRLEVSGTTLSIFYDGVLQGATVTDSGIASGEAGLGYSSTSTAATVDDWEGGDLTAAGRTTKNVHSFGLGMQHGMGLGMPAGGRYVG